MEPIIEVKDLSKEYILSHQLPYVTFRDTVIDLAKKPFQLLRRQPKIQKEEFWALKDINFTVQKGEAIGLIGPNGSGKSTLLKILSQITAPTTGEIQLRGRVASLLEVGTGFHPELTGRENIFLNGAILGMTRAEISRKFDDIVAFSGVEKFLDTPVKRYSSGMHVRLAFSVAAHMEPEILIVDEVLAVGDADFQKKSLGKMDEVTKDAGRTIIFVSHNMDAIKRICTKCILLKDGKIEMFDSTDKVIAKYLYRDNQPTSVSLEDRKDRTGDGSVHFTDITTTNLKGSKTITSGDGVRITLKYRGNYTDKIKNVRVVITIVNENLLPVLRLDSDITANSFTGPLDPGGLIVCETEGAHLREGRYFCNIDFLVKGIGTELTSMDYVVMANEFVIEPNIQAYDYRIPSEGYDYLIKYRFQQG